MNLYFVNIAEEGETMRCEYSFSGKEWRVMKGGPWNRWDDKWFQMAKHWANKWALYRGHIGD